MYTSLLNTSSRKHRQSSYHTFLALASALAPTRRGYYSLGQIKLLGEGACVILCADGADVEARTYGTWGLVSCSPASPRASVFCSVGFVSPPLSRRRAPQSCSVSQCAPALPNGIGSVPELDPDRGSSYDSKTRFFLCERRPRQRVAEYFIYLPHAAGASVHAQLFLRMAAVPREPTPRHHEIAYSIAKSARFQPT